MSEANPHRGEIDIDLGPAGVFPLRPDFEAVAAIDRAVGGIMALAMRLHQNSAAMTLDEMAIIVAECMKGHARKTGGTAAANVEKVKRMIFEAGMGDALAACVQVVGAAIGGGAAAEPGDGGNA